jgi:UDP-glucose 4-epimerase
LLIYIALSREIRNKIIQSSMGKKKVLVTGGAGYIGAHTVVELAAAGYEAIIVDNLSKSDETLIKGMATILGYSPTFYRGNCIDKEFMSGVFEKEKSISCVMHFAAYKSVGESVQIPVDYYRNNIDSLITLLEVMKDKGVSDLIFSSSCTVYGEPEHVPVSEDAPIRLAESPYGATKQMCERILSDAYRTGFRVVSLRYFNPIGSHPSINIGELPTGVPNNLVPYVTQTAIGKRDKLTVFGSDYNTPDGSCVRDFIHVSDVALAHLSAMEYLSRKGTGPAYFVFNLGTGKGVSVLELIGHFEKATGVKVNYSIGPRRPGDVEKTYADPSRAFRELGWRPKYSIEEALLHAWKWEEKVAGLLKANR